MLGDEHRVPAVGRLLTVVGRLRCGESPIDEIAGVRQNHREPPGFQIRTILLAKPEAASEARPCKPLEQRIEIIHQATRHQSSRPSPREQRERVSSEICTRPLSAHSDREGRPMDHIVSVGMDADTLAFWLAATLGILASVNNFMLPYLFPTGGNGDGN